MSDADEVAVATSVATRIVRPALAADAVRAAMDGIVREDRDDPGRFDAYLPSPAVQNHAANLMELANGDLGCVWFGGSLEGKSDISIHFSRLAPGSEGWSAPVRLSDDPNLSEQNPLLFNAPDGRLWLIFTAQPAGNQNAAIVRYRMSTDGGRSFGPIGVLSNAPGTFVRQPLVVAPSGDWLLPTFLCRCSQGEKWVGNDDISAVSISSDEGRTWSVRPVACSLGAVHMNIVPLAGNRAIAVYRSRWADRVHLSRSADGGRTWTSPEPTELPNNNSSVQMIRLASGRLALVYNHSSAANASERRAALYDDLDETDAPAVAASAPARARTAFWGAPRAPLSVALSEDDGRTWPIRVDLEVGDGYCLTNNSRERLNREFSYPSIRETAEGAIHIAFTYFRQAIKYVRVDENWLLARGRGSEPGR